MNKNSSAPWEQLFPSPTEDARAVEMQFRLVRKHGEPLLLVPVQRAAIQEALALYPAQTPKAKAARWMLAAGLRVGLGLGTRPITLRADSQSPFLRFLLPAGAAPANCCLALLCGNARAPGRRFILLLFDAAGRPAKLVKAGLGDGATALIRAEAAFLKSHPADLLHASVIIGEFIGDGLEALALEYAAGENPDPRDSTPLVGLLESWLRADRQVRVTDLPAWQRLGAVAQDHALFRRLESALSPAKVHPAIFHGDLAPWNVRVDPATGRWVVLDWERGEPEGPPGWDWFHFVIQTEILVRRSGVQAVAKRTDALLRSMEFVSYARKAGIEGTAQPLVLAYLLYSLKVIAPAEGAQALRDLLSALATRWNIAG